MIEAKVPVIDHFSSFAYSLSNFIDRRIIKQNTPETPFTPRWEKMYITSCGFTVIESHITLMYLVPLVALWLLYSDYDQRVRIAELQLLDDGPMWTIHATATRKLYHMRLDDNSTNEDYISGGARQQKVTTGGRGVTRKSITDLAWAAN
jgi:hypothetical protein